MRALAPITVSMVVHGLALLWLRPEIEPRPGTAALPAPSPITVEPAPEPEPISVEFLSDDASDRIAEATSIGPSIAAAPHGERTRTAISGTGVSAAHDAAREDHPSIMKMRYPERVGLTSHFLDDFLAHSKPLVRLPEVAGEQLHNDVRASEGRLNDWRWVANASPDALMAERERLDARRNDLAAVDLHPSGNGTYESRQTYAPHEGPPTADAPDVPVDGRALAPTDWITRQRGPEFTAHVARDGTVHFDDARNLQLNGRAGIGVMGTFDVTDALMRGHGNDPYAREKMKFLERTFDERVEIGRRDRHDQLMQSAELARRNVERLFAMTPALAARKTGLFELWDDCAESGDPELVAGGIAARALVVGIIRGRLRGADAYTADELARLNAHRQSKATFAPYE